MSTVHLAAETATTLAATFQINPTVPPGSNGFLKLIGWLAWFAQLAGVAAIIYGGGKFGWERWHGGALESPKIVAGALVGGVLTVTAGTIMSSVVGS